MSSTSLRIHFLSIKPSSELVSRISNISKEFSYNFLSLNSVNEVLSKLPDFEDTPFCLYEVSGSQSEAELSSELLALRKSLRDCFICVVTSGEVSKSVMDVIKKSGANLVLNMNDVIKTSRLEFVASQIIRGSYAQVNVSEFPQDVVLDFSLYHLLPLNQKMLPVLPRGTAFSEARLKKLLEVSELFVKRDELDKYRMYMDGRSEASSGGLKARARAKFLSYCSSHSQMIFSLIDRSEENSSKEGKWLYDRCEILAKDLLKSLSGLSESWEVLNNSSLGEFGSLERAPTVSAYAGLLSLLASIGEPMDVMMATLLADVGILDLAPEVTGKIRSSQSAEGLSDLDLKDYQNHPIYSLKHCEKQGLILSANIKKIILNSHEKINRKGFPNRPPGDQIPFEAMILQICQMIDNAMIVRLNSSRQSIQEVRRAILTDAMVKMDTFNYGFLDKLKPVL